MAYLRVHEVHLADAALVLLKGRDLPRIGRPEDDGAVAPAPAGIVRGIAEVLDTVLGDLRFIAGGGVAAPEVEIPDDTERFLSGETDSTRPPPAPPPRPPRPP